MGPRASSKSWQYYRLIHWIKTVCQMLDFFPSPRGLTFWYNSYFIKAQYQKLNGYIFPLFNLRVFLCFSKISDLQGFPCIGYNFFMFQIQGFPCFNNIFFLFWLYYFPVLWTFFPCFIYRVFPVFPKFYVVVFQRAGKSLL